MHASHYKGRYYIRSFPYCRKLRFNSFALAKLIFVESACLLTSLDATDLDILYILQQNGAAYMLKALL